MAGIAERYERFAEVEARGRSAVYERLALAIAGDPDVLALIAALPPMKQQPNLVLASARFVGAPFETREFLRWLPEHWAAVEAVILSRSTQTNEAARCAVLLPVLSAIDGPMALIEVGAAAGLCLLPDRYGYRYELPDRTWSLDPVEGSDVIIRCRAHGVAGLRMPEVAWRRGIDLHPLDVSDPGDAAWLRTLVWPGQDERLARLDAAIEVARLDPPVVVAGDALEQLAEVVAAAPVGLHVVVFHSAVHAYLSADDRAAFADLVRALGATWVSNEGVGVLPEVAARLDVPADPGDFVVAREGVPVALADAHGAWVRML